MNPNTTSGRSHTRESHTLWGIFTVAFLVLFIAALVAPLFGIQWRNLLPGAEHSKGLVGGVSAAVYTLMSHII
jgi:hypothetical protein